MMKAYIGTTAHFINEDWRLVSTLLNFEELLGLHGGKNIAVHLWEVVNKMLSPKQVSKMI